MIINGERALAYTVKVGEIEQIPGYDRVELASVNGWKCVVKKGEIKPGDMAVYFEVDSLVPSSDDRFAFLEKKHYKIKTQRMCGVYSQGLLMPIGAFPELSGADVGEDVTKTLGVTYMVKEDNVRKAPKPKRDLVENIVRRNKRLFHVPFVRRFAKTRIGRRVILFLFGGRKKKRNPNAFPSDFDYISKTDEERIENMPWLLGYKKPLCVTEKLDGTSTTYILERKGRAKYKFYIASRNVLIKSPEQQTYHDHNIYTEMAQKYEIEDRLSKYMDENPDLKYVCLQGESVGNVQGNPLKLDEDRFYVFNFIRSDVGRLSPALGKEEAEKIGVPYVPIIDTNYYMPSDMESVKQYATACSVINPDVLREGVVLREAGSGLSFKNVSREYLMKHGG